ncbi:IS630 family transposase [Candidatus Pacearchaeota archaeon]|nr:IS630 family transposase [Candidatus Pacearchaeota archaeon]
MQKEDGRSISRDALENYRFRTIQLHKEGKHVNEIAYFFGVHRGSVSRWITLYKRNGKNILQRKKAKGADYKLSKKELDEILSMLNDDATIYGFETPLWTCKRVLQMMFKKTNKTMHLTGIRKLFRKLNLSPQKPERFAKQKDRKAVKKWLREEWPKIEEHRRKWQAMLYFQDESGISLIPVVGRTWAPKGKTPKVMVTGNRGGFCVTSAVSPAGKLIFRIEKGRVNSEKHIEFLKNIIKQHPNRKIIVIEDRAPAHRAKKVNEFVEQNKKRLAIYKLPPYSPELNPTEHVWAYLKAYELKTHQAQNTEELKHLTKRKMHKIQKNKKLILSFF